MKTWQPDPFSKGSFYRVLVSFHTNRTEFKEGEILCYDHNSYSRYDGVSGFVFIDKEKELKCWDLNDSESSDSWIEYFEEVKE